MFYSVPLTIKYTGGLEGQVFSHLLERGVVAANATEAKRSVLLSECDLLNEELIDAVCEESDYSLLNEGILSGAYEITNAKYEAGEDITVIHPEDDHLEYEIASPVELQVIDATVDGVEQKIYVPIDTSLLKTREQLSDAGKLNTEDSQLYCVEVNLYIASTMNGAVDKYFEVYVWGKDKEEAKFNAMLSVCQETTLEDTLTRVDDNGVWDTCDDSGAYTVDEVFQMVETEVTLNGNNYVVFVAENSEIFDVFVSEGSIGYMGDHKIAKWDV